MSTKETTDGCCGGGIGPVPYLGCVDCPRRPETTLTLREQSVLSAVAHDIEPPRGNYHILVGLIALGLIEERREWVLTEAGVAEWNNSSAGFWRRK